MKLMDSIEFERNSDGNVLVLTNGVQTELLDPEEVIRVLNKQAKTIEICSITIDMCNEDGKNENIIRTE